MSKYKHTSVDPDTSEDGCHKKEHPFGNTFDATLLRFVLIHKHHSKGYAIDEEEYAGELGLKCGHRGGYKNCLVLYLV